MEYGGANLVPIAAPRFCLNVLLKTGSSCFLKLYLPIQLKCRLLLPYFIYCLSVF